MPAALWSVAAMFVATEVDSKQRISLHKNTETQKEKGQLTNQFTVTNHHMQ